MSSYESLASWKQWVLFFTSFPFLLLMRWLWQTHPGVWPCVAFWVLALCDEPIRLSEMGTRRRWLYGLTFIGGLCNAAATLANSGHMPVLNHEGEPSLWIPLTSASRLPWLCDIYSGASIGDFLIFGGLLALLANWLLEKYGALPKEAFAAGKRIPGFGIG